MRTIAETINDRVARYTFFMLLLSAGMWSASVCECTRLLKCHRLVPTLDIRWHRLLLVSC